MKEEVKNLYIAIMLSVLVIFGVDYFFPTPKETPQNDIIVTPEVESTETIVTNENLTEEKILKQIVSFYCINKLEFCN